jgi:hypothetical protein
VRIIERFEDPHPPNSRVREQFPRLADMATERGCVIDRRDADDERTRRRDGRIVDELKPFDQLACEDGGQVLNTNGVEPLEESLRSQHLGHRLERVQRHRHQDPLRVGA